MVALVSLRRNLGQLFELCEDGLPLGKGACEGELQCRKAGGYILLSWQVFTHPALKKAKTSIRNAGQFVGRQRMFIQQCVPDMRGLCLQ